MATSICQMWQMGVMDSNNFGSQTQQNFHEIVRKSSDSLNCRCSKFDREKRLRSTYFYWKIRLFYFCYTSLHMFLLRAFAWTPIKINLVSSYSVFIGFLSSFFCIHLFLSFSYLILPHLKLLETAIEIFYKNWAFCT